MTMKIKLFFFFNFNIDDWEIYEYFMSWSMLESLTIKSRQDIIIHL